MSDLRSQAKQFLERVRAEADGGVPTVFDDVPCFIEHQAGSEPPARTWREFLISVLAQFLEGGSLADPDVRNNLALYLACTAGDDREEVQECRAILEGIWTRVYGP